MLEIVSKISTISFELFKMLIRVSPIVRILELQEAIKYLAVNYYTNGLLSCCVR